MNLHQRSPTSERYPIQSVSEAKCLACAAYRSITRMYALQRLTNLVEKQNVPPLL